MLGGLLVALAGALVHYLREDQEVDIGIAHHYGLQALGVGVTWAIVFRTQLAWHRYWEAVTQLHFYYSKFVDVFSQFAAFAEVSLKGAQEDAAKTERIQRKQRRLKANFALLSALAADRLTLGDNQRMEDTRARRAQTRTSMRIQKESQGFQQPAFAEADKVDRDDRKDTRYKIFQLPSSRQMRLLESSQDAVSTVMYWIIWDLADAMKDLSIAPPIQSRMYQELSNGMLGFNNCVKVADVPFPLPFAQLLGILLAAFSCLMPVYVVIFTQSPIVSPIVCFFLFESLWCLNEVAKELENPFGQDVNDISVNDFHVRFVDTLMSLSSPKQQAVLHHPSLGLPDPDAAPDASAALEVALDLTDDPKEPDVEVPTTKLQL